MRTSEPIRMAALACALAMLALQVPAALATGGGQKAQLTFKSPEAAYEQGMGAWRSGFIEHAVPALEYAAQRDMFQAMFYLARIYADGNTAYTDHAAAYRLYLKLANDYADIDPDDDQRAPFVAKALTALAIYVKDGVAAAGVRPDPARAVQYLRHAAQFFNHEDAQFELAKLHLKGEGVAQDPRTAMHWLSVLAQRGHPGAQAFLADIYWRGRYGVQRDQLRAFALISVAAENAPDTERVWIEDIYQNIFCGASAGTRTQAQGMVADWRQRYGRSISGNDRYSLGALAPRADRTCGNGEPVGPFMRNGTESRQSGTVPTTGLGLVQGNVLGIGVTQPGPAR